MTKKELSQLYWLNREIERDKDRLSELESAAQPVAQKITGMPSGAAVSDKIGSYAAEIADLKGIIDANISRCFYEMNRLNRYIASVEDSQMRLILSLRYINGLSWQQVAFSIGETDESYPRRKHNTFLKLAENAEPIGDIM